jgi:hypothetical protein
MNRKSIKSQIILFHIFLETIICVKGWNSTQKMIHALSCSLLPNEKVGKQQIILLIFWFLHTKKEEKKLVNDLFEVSYFAVIWCSNPEEGFHEVYLMTKDLSKLKSLSKATKMKSHNNGSIWIILKLISTTSTKKLSIQPVTFAHFRVDHVFRDL